MRLDGRRTSSNISDRRSGSGGKIAGIGGIGGLIIVALIVWLAGGDPISVLTDSAGYPSSNLVYSSTLSPEKEQEYAEFAGKILAGTEDVWTEQFKKMGLTYREPKMVL